MDADGSGRVDCRELKAVVKAFYQWQKQRIDDAKINADVEVWRSGRVVRRMKEVTLR